MRCSVVETIHDMSNPVGALRAMRGLISEGGTIVIADENVAEEFAAPGDEVERFIRRHGDPARRERLLEVLPPDLEQN